MVILQCPRPVIAAIHGACVGAAVDMVSACDIRHCTKDAWFSIKVPSVAWLPVRLLPIPVCIAFPQGARSAITNSSSLDAPNDARTRFQLSLIKQFQIMCLVRGTLYSSVPLTPVPWSQESSVLPTTPTCFMLFLC